MSAAAAKKKRFRGAGGLWLAVAVLALVYVTVWSVDRSTGSLPQSAGSVTSKPAAGLADSAKQPLIDKAQQDAASRAPGADIKVVQVQPVALAGSDLHLASGGIGQPGLVITFEVVRDGQPTERLTYHAAPPDQVVFVEQKPA